MHVIWRKKICLKIPIIAIEICLLSPLLRCPDLSTICFWNQTTAAHSHSYGSRPSPSPPWRRSHGRQQPRPAVGHVPAATRWTSPGHKVPHRNSPCPADLINKRNSRQTTALPASAAAATTAALSRNFQTKQPGQRRGPEDRLGFVTAQSANSSRTRPPS